MIASKLKKINIMLHPQKLFYSPEWIVLGVNNICNLHCKMCDVGTGYDTSNFYHHLAGNQPVNMPLPLIKKIIDETSEYFPEAKLGYAFTEPSVYPHLVESLEYARDKNLHTSLTTNGLNLSKIAAKLCDSGLNELFVSLDGPPEIHNKIRGHNRSFENAIEGIRNVIWYKGRKPDVSVFCTITEWNISTLAEFAEIFRNIPLTSMGFMHTNFTPDSIVNEHNSKYGNNYPATISNMYGININKMDIKVLQTEIEKVKKIKTRFRIKFSPEINSLKGLETFYFEPEKLIGRICNDSFRNIMIKSDGTVIPSHGRCYNVIAGNIYHTNLKEIWNSSSISDFRKTLIEAGGLLPACSRCCSAF